MIIETSQKNKDYMGERYEKIHILEYDKIFDLNGYFDYYTIIMNLLYKSKDRFIVNSTINFFLKFRRYIIDGGWRKDMGELGLWNLFNKSIERVNSLLASQGEYIYIHKADLEVIQFCKYYNIRYKIIESKEEFRSLIHKSEKRGNIF